MQLVQVHRQPTRSVSTGSVFRETPAVRILGKCVLCGSRTDYRKHFAWISLSSCLGGAKTIWDLRSVSHYRHHLHVYGLEKCSRRSGNDLGWMESLPIRWRIQT